MIWGGRAKRGEARVWTTCINGERSTRGQQKQSVKHKTYLPCDENADIEHEGVVFCLARELEDENEMSIFS